jgi:uncharacterized membrane protein/heat shock protein HslJ
MIKSVLLIILSVFVIGCTANKPVSKEPESGNGENILKNYDAKRSAGIDLTASGNEPFWIVDMDTEDSTKIFILSDNYTVRYKTPALFIDSVSKTIIYTFDTDVTLTIKRERCKDSMSGEIFSFSATLRILNRNYKGCGKYIIASVNPFLSRETLRLNDLWALKKFRSQNIDPKSFKEGVPVLELHLNDGRFLGNSKCNTITGSIDAGDSYIIFSDFTSTKKLCEGDFEQQYIQDLKSVDSWSFDKMKLILMSKGKEILEYNKID